MLPKLFCATLLLLPVYAAAISEPPSNSDLSATQHPQSPHDVGRPAEYHEIMAMLDGLDQPMLKEIKHHVSILRTLDHSSLQRFKHLVSQHLPAATEQPEGTEEFVEVDEVNSVGRRGGQTAAGGFVWAVASGNRAGNSEDEEELGQEDSSSQAATTRRRRWATTRRRRGATTRRRRMSWWEKTRRRRTPKKIYDADGCRVAWAWKDGNTDGKKVCKAKYGKCMQQHCWKFDGDWTCPGCWDQPTEAKKVANAITATWESKRGEAYCNKHMKSPKLIQIASINSASVEDFKKQLGHNNADLHEIDVSDIAADFRWKDHLVVHRSGIHEANEGMFLLCASWTAVCLGTPPSKGQSCATVRKVLGCKKKKEDWKWHDCSKWYSSMRLALPDLA